MNDDQTRIIELRTLISEFVDQRQWQQFHAPKNLSMALAIEAAELMEHFQWLTVEQSRQLADEPEQLSEVADELADVVAYALALANALDIDISRAVQQKMQKNVAKYPADQFRGRYGTRDRRADARDSQEDSS